MEENKIMEGTGSNKNVVAKLVIGGVVAAVAAAGALILKKRKQNKDVESQNESEQE